jgi:hypothetical protein
MATPLPHLLGLYYPSKDLLTDGGVLPSRTVGADSTQSNITVTNIDESSGYWDGAVGFFTSGAAALLQTCFHVRRWDKDSQTLTLAQPLPSVPVSGNAFKLFLGGGGRSNTKLLGLQAGGIQPELASVTATTIAGITIKYISPYLGTGTLTLTYSFKTSSDTRKFLIKMGSEANGEATVVTANGEYIVYSQNGSGFIIISVTYASLPTYASSDKTQTFTLTQPTGSLVPSFEGYETNTGKVSDRFHLLVAKNESVPISDIMSAFSIWLDKPVGVNTTLSAAINYNSTSVNIAAATNWPSRGFWITNGTQYRYVLYRSDLTLYLAVPTTARLNFTTGIDEILPGDVITYNNTYTFLVDKVVLTSGSWGGHDATGYVDAQKLSVASAPNGYVWYDSNSQQKATGSATNFYSRREPIGTWASGATVYPAPDIDVGIEIPDENGIFQSPIDEHTAPDGVTFNGKYIDQNTALIHEGIHPQKNIGIWIREHILESMQTRANVDGDINFAWY